MYSGLETGLILLAQSDNQCSICKNISIESVNFRGASEGYRNDLKTYIPGLFVIEIFIFLPSVGIDHEIVKYRVTYFIA